VIRPIYLDISLVVMPVERVVKLAGTLEDPLQGTRISTPELPAKWRCELREREAHVTFGRPLAASAVLGAPNKGHVRGHLRTDD
jgi:hypothetical protein